MKKLIITLLFTLLLASCSGEENGQSWNVQDSTTNTVNKNPMSVECASWSPIGKVCGGWMVKWRHAIVSPSGCDYGGKLPGMSEDDIPRKCGGGKDTVKEAWNFATKFCDGMKFQGFDDWRLPTKDEVEQVFVDTEKTVGFSKFNTDRDSKYWLSSSDPSDTNSAMTVYFEGGMVRYPYSNQKSTENFVRCIREF